MSLVAIQYVITVPSLQLSALPGFLAWALNQDLDASVLKRFKVNRFLQRPSRRPHSHGHGRLLAARFLSPKRLSALIAWDWFNPNNDA